VVLTAAHCIEWNVNGGRADCCFSDVRTRDGCTLRATPWAVELITDLAVMGSVDDGRHRADFEAWCERTPGVRVGRAEYPLFDLIPVYVLSHEGEWIEGRCNSVARRRSA